jgi:hypothetical protein
MKPTPKTAGKSKAKKEKYLDDLVKLTQRIVVNIENATKTKLSKEMRDLFHNLSLTSRTSNTRKITTLSSVTFGAS